MSPSEIRGFRGATRFLSNFYPAPAELDGVLYPSVEHAFQAAKTFDPDDRARIAAAPTPGEAKSLGRRVRLRADWEDVCRAVMHEVVLSKFTLNPDLGQRLIDTGGTRLVEDNVWHDQRWGNCTCGRPACEAPGKNWLGGALMSVRQQLWSRAEVLRVAGPDPDVVVQGLADALAPFFERGNDVGTWPADEAAAYRELLFAEGHAAARRIVLQKAARAAIAYLQGGA